MFKGVCNDSVEIGDIMTSLSAVVYTQRSALEGRQGTQQPLSPQTSAIPPKVEKNDAQYGKADASSANAQLHCRQ